MADLADHCKLGAEQELFYFDKSSPGSCCFEPRGTQVYKNLIECVRSEYHNRGFVEVITPMIYDAKLLRVSGHWTHYAGNMFVCEVCYFVFLRTCKEVVSVL